MAKEGIEEDDDFIGWGCYGYGILIVGLVAVISIATGIDFDRIWGVFIFTGIVGVLAYYSVEYVRDRWLWRLSEKWRSVFTSILVAVAIISGVCLIGWLLIADMVVEWLEDANVAGFASFPDFLAFHSRMMLGWILFPLVFGMGGLVVEVVRSRAAGRKKNSLYVSVYSLSMAVGVLALGVMIIVIIPIKHAEASRAARASKAIDEWGIDDPRTVTLLLKDYWGTDDLRNIPQGYREHSVTEISRLGETGSSLVIAPLVETIHDKGTVPPRVEGLRAAAIDALAALGKEEAITPLLVGKEGEKEVDYVYSPDLGDSKYFSLLDTLIATAGNHGIDLAMESYVGDGFDRSDVLSFMSSNSNVRFRLAVLLGRLAVRDNNQYATSKLMELARIEMKQLYYSERLVARDFTGYADRRAADQAHARKLANRHYALNALVSTGRPETFEMLFDIASTDSILTAARLATLPFLAGSDDERADSLLIEVVTNKETGMVREEALEPLGDLGVESAVPIILPLLTDWNLNKQAAVTLTKLNWSPTNEKDWVRFWVAKREGTKLESNWSLVSKILLSDVRSGTRSVIQNAVYAFIGIGREEIIPVLRETLSTEGNKTMAEVFLNSGSAALADEARDWAERRGYKIEAGRGAHPVSWGSIR